MRPLIKINLFLQRNYVACIMLSLMLGVVIGLLLADERVLKFARWGTVPDWMMFAATLMLIWIGSTLPQRLADQSKAKENLFLADSIRRDIASVIGNYRTVYTQFSHLADEQPSAPLLDLACNLPLPLRDRYDANSYRIHLLEAAQQMEKIYSLSSRIEAERNTLKQILASSGSNATPKIKPRLKSLCTYLAAYLETHEEMWKHLKSSSANI